MVFTLRFAGVVAIGMLTAASLPAQRNASTPTTFAITNARLVPISGPVIDKGTIVIRDGLIAAIGANPAVPGDARVIDGTGLSIYPGFIEAFGSLGYAAPAAAPAAAAAAGGRGGRGGLGAAAAATPATSGPANSSYPRGFQPEMNAVDDLDEDASFDAAHAAGFTTAFTTLSAGGFRGSSAIINLRNDAPSAIVLKSPVAQSLSFSRGAGGRGGGGGGGGYPGSLMGVISQLRQELMDAQHYRDVKVAYAKSPLGMQRPALDASLEALQPVLAGTQPVVMVANSQREIERALDLAKEFSFKLVIAGGSEAYKIADRLKAENVPVLLSVAFPRRTGGGGADADPEPIQTLRERVEAPKAPALFAKAGVKFAFYAGSNWNEYLANVRRAVDNGLLTEQALKAMITTPAEMFGVADRVGTLEVGKIANLTIMRGDLFEKTATVNSLFIDGHPVSIVAGAAAPQTGGGGGRGGLSGTWGVRLNFDGRDQQVTFTLVSHDGLLTGTLQGALGASDIVEGAIEDDGSFSFAAPIRMGGADNDDAAVFSGTFRDGILAGSMKLEGHRTGTFSNRGSN